MHEVGGGFKDDGVGELNTACITGRLDAAGACNTGDRAYHGAQRQGTHLAYRGKVTKAHGVGREMNQAVSLGEMEG